MSKGIPLPAYLELGSKDWMRHGLRCDFQRNPRGFPRRQNPSLDDFINPKTGRKIFGCSHIFDHAAKTNQSKYPWAQNVVVIGLLKRIKGRWACLPLAHRFYLPKNAIDAKLDNMKVPGKDTSFQTKLDQAVEMLVQVFHHFGGLHCTR